MLTSTDALAAGETALREAVDAERQSERAASEAREARAAAEARAESARETVSAAVARIREDLDTTPAKLLETLDAAWQEAATPDDVAAAMKAAYPGYGGEFLLSLIPEYWDK